MTFGQYVRTRRKEQHISQRDLAERVGINFTYLSKIETGDTDPPSEEVIWKIARVLEADGWDLLNRAGKIPKAIRAILEDNPLAVELLRLLSSRRLSEAVYRQLIALAKSEEAS
jgi:transcriptional regulator with XRE-family HTH domain